MKKFKYIYVLSLFVLFIPKVYAFSYDINTNVDSTSVKAGTKKEIKVSINNIQDTTEGVVTCSMNILFDKNISLDSSIKTLSSWSMMTGDMYLFDTGSPVFDSSEMFLIPVKVNGEGSIQFTNIICSDGVEEIEINSKKISFTILDESDKEQENNNSNNNGNIGNNNDDSDNHKDEDNKTTNDDSKGDTSNCNLSDIKLSEGTIEFDSNVTEYEVKITNFDDFRVTPVLESSSASYLIDRNVNGNSGSIVITVNANDGSSKVYTIYTTIGDSSVNSSDNGEKKNKYVPIFIGVICVLVLINIFRIVRNMKKK